MSPHYVAPEVLEGRVSQRTDQYSLAVTYFQLRTGRLPFAGDSVNQVLYAHVHRPPDLSGLPEEERAVVARALAKRPEDRWPSCREFVRRLARPHAASETTADARAPPVLDARDRPRAARPRVVAPGTSPWPWPGRGERAVALAAFRLRDREPVRTTATGRSSPAPRREQDRATAGRRPTDPSRLPPEPPRRGGPGAVAARGTADAVPRRPTRRSGAGQGDLPGALPGVPRRRARPRGASRSSTATLLVAKEKVVPGKPDESALFLLVTADDDTVMPPEDQPRLAADEIDAIRAWIAAGAPPFPPHDGADASRRRRRRQARDAPQASTPCSRRSSRTSGRCPPRTGRSSAT